MDTGALFNVGIPCDMLTQNVAEWIRLNEATRSRRAGDVTGCCLRGYPDCLGVAAPIWSRVDLRGQAGRLPRLENPRGAEGVRLLFLNGKSLADRSQSSLGPSGPPTRISVKTNSQVNAWTRSPVDRSRIALPPPGAYETLP